MRHPKPEITYMYKCSNWAVGYLNFPLCILWDNMKGE